ncbi:FecR family protein [Pseudomonas qingdaonensis]|uniref:FecR family protein n=1 Tax=Pseudomonas qingdaonensis TaxID=2056231 RepID=UPI001F2F49E4|nr:FecR domain-containing protein [Pseudomonas qingdaonensis]
MTRPNPSQPSPVELEDQAIEQWVMLMSGNASESDHSAFRQWRQRSPAHEAAARLAEQMWHGVAQTATAQSFVPPAPQRRAKPLRWAALAAGLAVLAVTQLGQPMKVYMADQSTAVGERRHLVLEDGSEVWLNSASALSVRYSSTRRDIDLIKGEALFQVSKNPARPFVVHAAAGTAQALGTRFDVNLLEQQVRVGVSEGVVQVTSGGQSARLEPAQQLDYAQGLPPSSTRPLDLTSDSAWQRGKLIFNRRPLDEVVSEIGRYVPGALVVTGQLPSTAVSGVFNLDDGAQMFSTLARTQPLRVVQLPWLTLVMNRESVEEK